MASCTRSSPTGSTSRTSACTSRVLGRTPAEDTLSVLPGIIGHYPGLVRGPARFAGRTPSSMLCSRSAARRTGSAWCEDADEVIIDRRSDRFWPFLDEVHNQWFAEPTRSRPPCSTSASTSGRRSYDAAVRLRCRTLVGDARTRLRAAAGDTPCSASFTALDVRRCKPAPGTTGSPSTIEEAVQLANGLPFPVTAECFVRGARPPAPHRSDRRARTACNRRSTPTARASSCGRPKRSSIAIVIDGEQRVTWSSSASSPRARRSVKGEIAFPLTEPLSATDPLDRVRNERHPGDHELLRLPRPRRRTSPRSPAAAAPSPYAHAPSSSSPSTTCAPSSRAATRTSTRRAVATCKRSLAMARSNTTPSTKACASSRQRTTGLGLRWEGSPG